MAGFQYNPNQSYQGGQSYLPNLINDDDNPYKVNVGGGQSTMVNGQPVQIQPSFTGTNSIVPYKGSDGIFGSNSGLVRYTGGGDDNGFGLNLGTFGMIGNALGGIGSLAKGYAAIKGLGLAKKQLAQNQEQFERNFGQQKQAYDDTVRQYNNIQGERQAFVNATHADPSLSNIKTLQLA